MNVALILFNRPDLTQRVFAEIAKAQPNQLFLIADGPRPDRSDDIERCAAARAVVERVDWDCKVHTNFSATNLGCGGRPATGISWVFEHVEDAIILEDDCIPNRSFFRFCSELLERYADDERVVQISGNFHQFGERRGEHSYFFSRYNVCAGGFATWRRAWRVFDLNASYWPRVRNTGWLRYATGDADADRHWRDRFDAAYSGHGNVDFWDFQWVFACLLQNGLTAIPNAGLLSNVGFRADGTHTRRPDRWANLPVADLRFPLDHPPFMTPHAEADDYFVRHVMTPPSPPLAHRFSGTLHSGIHHVKRAAAGLISMLEVIA